MRPNPRAASSAPKAGSLLSETQKDATNAPRADIWTNLGETTLPTMAARSALKDCFPSILRPVRAKGNARGESTFRRNVLFRTHAVMKEEIQKRTVSCVNPENFLMLKGGPVVSAAPAPREVPRRVQGALRVATSLFLLALDQLLGLPKWFLRSVEQYQCKICPSGFHANNKMSLGATGCRVPPGLFWEQDGQVDPVDGCFACPAGFYWKGRPEDVSDVCGSCPEGRYNNEIGTIGLSFCEPCLPGRYGIHSESDNVDACLGCEPGKFSPEIAAHSEASCKPCAEGQYQSFPNSSTCTLCPVGWVSSGAAAAFCLQCSPGFFSDKLESLSCTACPTGWSQGNNGSAWCSKCQPGQFRGEERSAESCGSCLPGRFRGEDHSPTECKSCPKGWFQSEEGAKSCRECPPGRFRGNDHSPDSCRPCLRGTHQPRETADHCRPCPPGTYTDTEGEASCKECEAGRFVATNTSRTCHSCAHGQFSAREGKTACDPCPLGQRSNENFVACVKPEWTTAGDCKVGQEYLNNSDDDTLRWSCVACPAGAQCVEDMVGGGRARQIHELRVRPGFWNASFPELDGLHPEVTIVACVFPRVSGRQQM